MEHMFALEISELINTKLQTKDGILALSNSNFDRKCFKKRHAQWHSSNYGAGQPLLPLSMAYPHSLGHVTSRSRQSFALLVQRQKGSKGWIKSHRPAAKKAAGHARNNKTQSQHRELQHLVSASGIISEHSNELEKK
mmetsp:Transcript_13846/g.21102  ORF Transcript_13846/g.21102 Transcript_13846/m.21102 type:complete len:137 (+) Transcript_13846:136-546(+)